MFHRFGKKSELYGLYMAQEMKTHGLLGIDAGSISLKMTWRQNGHIRHLRQEHFGEPLPAFEQMLQSHKIRHQQGQAMLTGKYAEMISRKYNIPVVSPISCLINTLSPEQLQDIRYFVDIGSSGLSVVEIQDRKFQRYDTNSLCAAGTGAFLDQQMKRMGLDYEQIQNIPIIENPPGIASRCAVFAKSDLIHRQQQGYSIDQLWNGLVKGLAESAYSTLFRGKTIQHDVFLIGGLANNKIFLHFFRKLLNHRRLVVAGKPDFFWTESLVKYLSTAPVLPQTNGQEKAATKVSFEKELSFESAPEKTHRHHLDAHGNEVDIWHLEKGKHYEVFAGLDVGSTSTKMALVDADGKILAGLYTRTRGKPVDAFKGLLEGLITLEQQESVRFSVKGFGTTGSGRNLLGHFAGADLVKNEITAHLKGAIKEFPEVKTIFEIGGQDSKYILVENGWMKDANMNYVCAAGTGSFLEEQAKNLNIALDDIPAFCKGAKPPISNDRCTVFMEQDANQLLAKGFTKNQVMASILYSVCKNYLNRVVHNRPVKEPVLFLGATAKNRGLVEAFENVIGEKVHTSQYSHIMGAIGMAEMLRNQPPDKTGFKGISLRHRQISLNEEQCGLCNNLCRITHMQVEEEQKSISWGYMCGKEPEEKSAKENLGLEAIKHLGKAIHSRPVLKEPATTVYFPRGLQYFSYNPFWQHFFKELNIRLQPTPVSNGQILSLSRSYALTDFCFPLKLAIGHVMHALKNFSGPVLVPFHIQDTANPKAANSFFCPLSQAFPSILKSTLGYNDMPTHNLLTPLVDFSKDAEYNTRQLEDSLRDVLYVSRKKIREAYQSALEKEREVKTGLRETGKAFIEKKTGEQRPRFVILGRGYNILDNILNLGILSSIARYGYDVIPMDVLPLERKDMPKGYHDMYWSYGQKIIMAAHYIAKKEDLYPVFLTNFSCGPDSFLLSVFEQILKEKPYLILELDEHGGDAGYLTRLEAYFDRVEHHYSHGSISPAVLPPPSHIEPRLADYRVYIPPMHPFGSRLMSAAIRAFGIDAVALTQEDTETFSLGRKYVRGSECMPAASTIGAFLHKLSQEKGKPAGTPALFMPCTSGPCRFGQYARLHDQILQKLNINAKIISPNSDDNYEDIKGSMRVRIVKGLIAADVLFKVGCRLRPYEKQKGSVDKLLEQTLSDLEKALEQKASVTRVLKNLNQQLKTIPLSGEKKPLVGVVGEIYVRNSPFSNSGLIKSIEVNGGEAWVAPMMEWMHYAAEMKVSENFLDMLTNNISTGITHLIDKKYHGIFRKFIADRNEPPIREVVSQGKKHLPTEVEGESILTIGRAIGFIRQKAALVVNVSPFGCMPGSISSSVLRNVSKEYNTPVVSVFYDGETDFSDLVATYIQNAT